jgi:hypothetical protein
MILLQLDEDLVIQFLVSRPQPGTMGNIFSVPQKAHYASLWQSSVNNQAVNLFSGFAPCTDSQIVLQTSVASPGNKNAWSWFERT